VGPTKPEERYIRGGSKAWVVPEDMQWTFGFRILDLRDGAAQYICNAKREHLLQNLTEMIKQLSSDLKLCAFFLILAA